MKKGSQTKLTDIHFKELGVEDERFYEALLNQSFPVPKGSSFFDDFPIWSNQFDSRTIKIGAFDSQNLIGCAGLRFANLTLPLSEIKIGIIGGVVVHPQYRKKGVANQLIKRLVEVAKTEQSVMVILWGSEHELYQRLGFELCGLQVRVPLAKLDLPKAKGIIRFGWRQSIFEAMQKRNSGLKLDSNDISWLSAHKNVQWLSEETLTDQSSYVGFNRGIDLRGMVHEWGGPRNQVKNLLARVLEQIPSAEILGSPAGIKSLGFSFEPNQLEYLCLAKILDPLAIMKATERNTSFQCSQTHTGQWSLKVNGQKIENLTSGELTKLFFGPEKIRGFNEAPFPIPFWVWGLDAA